MVIHLYTSFDIYTPLYYHYNLIEELEKLLGKPKLVGENTIPGVHLFFAFAKEIFKAKRWFKNLKGPKIIIEHDAYLNFMKQSEYYRAWNDLSDLSLIISSGKKTTEKLLNSGIPAVWVSKGTNKSFLGNTNTFSGKIGVFASPIAERNGNKFSFYDKRREMLKFGLPNISSEVKDFSKVVSLFSACCINDEAMEEPMAKHFEASALGCLPIRDYQEELYDLGYDDNSMLMYRNFDEMMDCVKLCNAEKLVFMQKKTKEVAKNHTWEKKAKEIVETTKKYIKIF